MNLVHLQVKTAHGLNVNMGLRIRKGALPAPKDPIQQVEVSAPWFFELSTYACLTIPFGTVWRGSVFVQFGDLYYSISG